MILLAGVMEEGPMAMVRTALEARGAQHLVFDQHCPATRASLNYDGVVLSGCITLPDGRSTALAKVGAAYTRMADHRRMSPWRDADLAGRVAIDDTNASIATFLEASPGLVLNRSEAMASNRSKPYQAALIRSLGFAVPETLVTNDPEIVREFLARHGRVVFKSASGVRSIVTELTLDLLPRLHRLHACPVQFQALVLGLDVRVHVVGDAVFPTACHAPVIDYRYAGREKAEATLTPFDLPENLAGRCVALAQSLDLPLCGIDLKRTPDGRWFCFEANPSPGFSWYENETGQPISAAIAALLHRVAS